MSQSSFSTLASDDRAESLDSLSGQGAIHSHSSTSSQVFDTSKPILGKTPKTGSFVMCVSMAAFYGGDAAAAKDEEDFGLDNPFFKELGLDDKDKLTMRKSAITEAAERAKKKFQANERRSNLQEATGLNPRTSNLQELSATQFSPMVVRQEFMKRQDASTKAFTPAILQALAEKKDDHQEPVVITTKPASKRKPSKLEMLKRLMFGDPDAKQRKKKANWNIVKMEERAEW